MLPRRLARILAPLTLLAGTQVALAHTARDGGTVHWHATDTAGFLTVAVLAALALWLSRED